MLPAARALYGRAPLRRGRHVVAAADDAGPLTDGIRSHGRSMSEKTDQTTSRALPPRPCALWPAPGRAMKLFVRTPRRRRAPVRAQPVPLLSDANPTDRLTRPQFHSTSSRAFQKGSSIPAHANPGARGDHAGVERAPRVPATPPRRSRSRRDGGPDGGPLSTRSVSSRRGAVPPLSRTLACQAKVAIPLSANACASRAEAALVASAETAALVRQVAVARARRGRRAARCRGGPDSAASRGGTVTGM